MSVSFGKIFGLVKYIFVEDFVMTSSTPYDTYIRGQ